MSNTNPRAERFKRFYERILSLPVQDSLHTLAKIYRTDKRGRHHYIDQYISHLEPLRKRSIKLLEIGVGGYENPLKGGKSLRMWKSYFPKGQIYAIDIHDKTAVQEPRIKIFRGSQVDRAFLEKVIDEIGAPDVIIDDGSHINEHVITTFKALFPRLKNQGLYFVEDTQTSYWPAWGGDAEDRNNPGTMMNFFKGLADGLNYAEFPDKNYQPTELDKSITALHFYHNLAVVKKGKHEEKSNILQ